ncbi:MAG: hypothetical protein ACYDBZ_12020 [Steroidobacteraceae bacterium]
MLSLHNIAIPIAAAAAALGYLVFRICVHHARRARHERYTHTLRSEVCKEREALRSVVEALPEQLESAKRSRIVALRTRGPSSLEATRQWLGALELDLAEAKQLESQLPAADTDGADYSGMELDMQLAEILALSIRANRLADKYRRALTEVEASPDDSCREGFDAESLFDPAASLPAQARAQHAAMSFIAPS